MPSPSSAVRESGPSRLPRWRGLIVAACALVLVAGAALAVAKEDDKKPARRKPMVLNVEEARVALARVQVESHLFYYDERSKKTYAYVLERKGKEPTLKLVPIDKVKDSDSLARQVLPVRMAILAGAFPYKKQVQEYRTRLGLGSDDEVLTEEAPQKEKNKNPQFAFRFLRVVVERRELDHEGKPAAGQQGQWKTLDLDADYRDYALATGRVFEPEDSALGALAFRGLVMPRLPQFRSGPDAKGGDKRPAERKDKKAEKEPKADAPDQYPPVEKALTKLAQTLESLKDVDPATLALPSRSSGGDDDFGAFDAAPPSKDKPKAVKPKKGRELPEHCLVRVVDVTVQPGKTYEYRLKVRMANPNFQRKDTADADARTLESAEWSETLILRVDPDLHYYAVNEQEVARARSEKYSDKYSRENLRPDRIMFFQAHRWVESIHLSKESVPLGEWAVSERFPVFRGEYVGRFERVEIPRWNPRLEVFTIASDASTSKKNPGINVNFGYGRTDGKEAILVDFEYGLVNYNRVVEGKDRTSTKRMTDESAGEALLLSPDGKLLLRETVRDVADMVRMERFEAVRKRLAAVKDSNRSADKDKGKPFGD